MERTYSEPVSVDEALAVLAELGPQAGIAAGGTDLVVAARSGKKPLPRALVAIHRLDELRGITNGSGVRLGALVTHSELESSDTILKGYTAIADACVLVGSPATRHAGTIGGNLCNGSPAMETGSPLLIYGASVELRSSTGSRTLPVAEFLVGPGRTARRDDELLTAVTLPSLPERSGSAYLRLEYRRVMEIAVVGAAALVTLDALGRCAEARVAITAVAPTCLRVGAAESALLGADFSGADLAEAARLAGEAARPIDDARAPVGYRRAMVPVIVRRALELALARAKEGT
jgi:CO/xanthine dehydrogenase FAD-binding subunit